MMKKQKMNIIYVFVMIILGSIILGGQAQAAEGLHTDNGVSCYEDAQGVNYGFYEDGVSCYVKGYVDNIDSEVKIPSIIVVEGRQYTVTVIEEKAFYWCDALTKIELPNTITAIKKKAFVGTQLKEIEIPNSVMELDATALNACTDLTNIIISKDNPKYSSDKQGCVYNKNKTRLIFAVYAVDDVVIPKTVKVIGEYAFDTTMLKSVKIPNSVKTIETNAFGYCSRLKSANIPNSVKVIEGWAFEYCDGLEKVTIGKNVTTIGKYAFENCFKLNKVTINSTKLKKIGDGAFQKNKNLKNITLKTNKLTKKSVGENVFKGTHKKLVVKVPSKKVNSYKNIFKNKGNKKLTVTK
ncbi:MAG: leucine-rich repeat domain-containing protein [Lachnospiraceae bacterium]|nr:leucine-rich repeat domain-containing protein [Lachnospiraceae bacterium]